VSLSTKLKTLRFCHSGLDPRFGKLTTLSKVEGESRDHLFAALDTSLRGHDGKTLDC
jgi:hypothetical protein